MSPLSTKPHVSDLQILNAILAMPDEKFVPPWNTKEKYRSMRYRVTTGHRPTLSARQRADAEEFYVANGLDQGPPPSSTVRTKKVGEVLPSIPAAPLVLPPHPLDVHLAVLPKTPPGRR